MNDDCNYSSKSFEGQSSLSEVNILGTAFVFCTIKHFERYRLHSKAHALLIDTILNVSVWAVPVFGLLLVDSVTFLSPIHIWSLNNFFQVIFMLWSVYPFSNIGIICNHTSWPLVCRKSNFPLPFPPLSLPPLRFTIVFPFPHSGRKFHKKFLSQAGRLGKWGPSSYMCEAHLALCGYMCEAHLAICVKPIWQFVWRPSGNLCEDHLAICVKTIWQFVWSLSGNLWEGHMAICAKPIWQSVWNSSGYLR